LDAKNFLKSEITDGELLNELIEKAKRNGLTAKDIESELQVLSRNGVIKYYYKSLEYEQRISVKDSDKLNEYIE
jgi:hypothetical protein